jgi:hypothetical protein
MVHGENGAYTPENRPQQMMRAGVVERRQPGMDQIVSKLIHSDGRPVRIQPPKVRGNR